MSWITLLSYTVMALQGTLQIWTPKELVKAPDGKTVVATIAGKEVTAEQVQKFLWDWSADEMLRDIVFVASVTEAAQRLGISVTDSEVSQYATTLYEEVTRDLKPGQKIEDELRSYKYPLSRVVFQAKGQLLLRKITERGFKPNEQIKIRRLLIKSKSSGADAKAEALKRATDLHMQLKGGANFEDLVRSASDDAPEMKVAGGLIGWVQPDELPSDMAEALRGLREGEISPVLDSGGVYLVLRIESRGALTGEELTKARNVYVQRNLETVWSKIEKEIKVEIKLNPNARPKG